jgi:hypothetical protein
VVAKLVARSSLLAILTKSVSVSWFYLDARNTRPSPSHPLLRGTLASVALSAIAASFAWASPEAPAPPAPPAAKPGAAAGVPAKNGAAADAAEPAKPTLEETRLTLNKWIETQQIISKERNDWQQAKEILQGRVELVGKEANSLREKIKQSEDAVTESNKKRDELTAENDRLKAVGQELNEAVTSMEAQVRKLVKRMPEPVANKLAPLVQRIPADPGNPESREAIQPQAGQARPGTAVEPPPSRSG